MIDVRCGAKHGRGDVRCQLYAGHVGLHTVLTQDEFGLVLRQWDRTGHPRDEMITAHTPLPYPWAPECPQVVAMSAKARGEVA